MRSISLIFTILTATALAQDPDECKFSETVQHCYGAEGQLLIFHVPNTANTDTNFRLKKDDGYLILKLDQNKIANAHEEFASHAELLSGGRLSLGKAMKKHSGDYMLQVFKANGEAKGTLNVHLEIQAPVSEPAVSQECLSSEKTIVSCSSKGDGLEFNLTLNGHSLLETKDNSKFLNSREENMPSLAETKAKNNPSGTAVSISLYGQLTGHLMCDVRNKVSRERTVFELNSCKVSSPFPVVLVATIAFFFAILLLVALHCVLISICNKNLTPVAENEDVTEDPEDEVIYSDVRITQNTRTTEPKPDQNVTSFCPGVTSSTPPA